MGGHRAKAVPIAQNIAVRDNPTLFDDAALNFKPGKDLTHIRRFFENSELVGVFNYEHRGTLPNRIAATFVGDNYRTYRLKKAHVFYRSGVEETELGQFFSFEKPASVIQTRIDNAIPPVWPNGNHSIINTGFGVEIPKGTIVHVGESTQQGGIFVGGTPQIVIENPRFIDGVKVIEKFSLERNQKYERSRSYRKNNE